MLLYSNNQQQHIFQLLYTRTHGLYYIKQQNVPCFSGPITVILIYFSNSSTNCSLNSAIMSGEEDTLECRVCRGDEEPGRPLVSPCLCRGSISYCHQSCLEEWLSFSQKTTCELCHTEYAFDPVRCYVTDRVSIQLYLTNSLLFWNHRFTPMMRQSMCPPLS